ncbi:MAG: TonB-dependent receptor plug domain-containing protein [Smithellaceae bacterium]|nr:TonB-dependent receptor plug domain-containing protein [Smithellaceae bacterium]
MMKRRLWGALCLFAVLFFQCPAFTADQKSEDPVRMEEVVVVASPIIEGNRVTHSGNQVTTVSKKQIDDLNAQDLPSALRRTPGINISRHNFVGSFGGGDGGAVYIRGMGSSRPGAEIQMLVDGVPKFAGIWTHPLMDIISVDIADRIDITKGAHPVLFGNMTAGAVNILTKTQKENGFSTSLRGAAGSYHTWIESLEHGGKISNTDYYLLQSFKQSSGHRENAGGELQNYFGHIGHQLSDKWKISLTANATHNFADDPGPENRPQERQGTFKTEDYLGIATLSHTYGIVQGDWKVYWNNGIAKWTDQYDLADHFYYDTITKFDNYGIRAREVIQPWTGGTFTVGADWDCTSGTVTINRGLLRQGSYFSRDTFRILSPYFLLGHEFNLIKEWKWIPSAGVRYYSHSDLDARWAPQAGIVLKDSLTDLHLFYGRGVNYPGLYVVAQSNMLWRGNTRWKDLDPETVDHLEAGIGRFLGPKTRIDLTWFYDKGSNRLIIITSPAPPHYENIANFETQGLEATLTVEPVKNLSLFTGGTWIYKRSPDNLPYAPEWTASAGGNLRLFRYLKISLDTTYQDSQYVANNRNLNYGTSISKIDGFWILNGKISWDFSLPKPALTGEIYLAGENLTNVHYAYKKDYPMPGINCLLGLNIGF